MHDTYQPDIATLVYHELRAPLGLMATTARAASDETDSEQLRRQCAVIERTAERMLRIATAVIESARSSKCGEASWYQPVNVVAGVLEDVPDVHFSSSCGLPILHTYGNCAQFEALVHSLAANARDHMEPGTMLTVTVENGCEEIRVRMQNRKAHIRFHQGLGLGLLLCQQLAEAAGVALSTDDNGTCFTVTLAIPVSEANSVANAVPVAV